jgi:hypothetical protein
VPNSLHQSNIAGITLRRYVYEFYRIVHRGSRTRAVHEGDGGSSERRYCAGSDVQSAP